jgi:hypothetical protein
MAMKKALAAAAVAAGLALVIGDTAMGAATVRTGNGGRGGAGGQGARSGDTVNIRNGQNNGVRGNVKRRSGLNAHPRKADPRPDNGFDF